MANRIRFMIAAVLAVVVASEAGAGEFVWLEGESGQANVKVNNAGWGNVQFLSEGKWMHISLDADKVEAEIKADAAVVQYPFQITQQARYEVWNRIGFEFARSPFDFRIDNGPWKTISPDDLTTDLMEVAFFCEVAWIKMGDVDLTPGGHTIEIRLPKSRDKEGKVQRILYASDAICIHEGEFHPHSRYRPNETGRDARDEAAADIVFRLPVAPAGQRASVRLKGLWEVTRDDEQAPGEVAAPILALPKVTFFKAIDVPSDKNESRKDLVFAHRLWYRSRVEVPAGMAGRAFYMDFPLNNLNTTVYVNGVLCGFEKNPFCAFQIDVTQGIRPGQTNEIWVGIRDAWYGRAANPNNPLKLRRTFNLPIKFFGDGFQELDYPIWNAPQSGILCAPTLVAAGGVYASDVFVKPSVEKRQLEAEVALTNVTGQDASGEIRWEAVNDQTGQVEKAFAARAFTVGAGRTQTLNLADGWENPRLWWPDTPAIYRLVTRVVVGGNMLDEKETPFGFREWRIEGNQFTLNGVVWHLWADLIGERGTTAEDWLKAYQQSNQRLMRFSTAGQAGRDPHWRGMEPQEALEFFDRNGVVVRRNCTLDGETIGTAFAEKDPDILRQQGGSEIKLSLMKNWADQCVAQVKGERNHPSIQIWSIENEFAFINLINLLGNSPAMDAYERQIKAAHDAVMAVDPTRSVMIDGGGALKENSLCVHGDHYVATLDSRYPDLAYEAFPDGGGRGRWQWDQRRPRYIGEDFYASGINPADYARWGGEVAFQGKATTREAVATCYRMLQEGYRWGGLYAAWHFWLGGEGGGRQRVANAPRAALCRQWDWTFGSGQEVHRTFGVFNDTQYPDPMTFTRILTVAGREAFRKTSLHSVRPGTAERFDEVIPMPRVASRTEGELVMNLTVAGKEVFRDVKAVSILPQPGLARTVGLGTGSIAVFDPEGTLAGTLKDLGIQFTSVTRLEDLAGSPKLVLVGPNAVSESYSTSTTLASLASTGCAVVVLDQTHPLRYQAIPAEMDLAPTTARSDFGQEMPMNTGRTAFIEDASHRALAGLADKDLFTWAGDHVVYRNPYMKPLRGAKSLVQVGPRLTQSALVEIPVGKGVMLLCQMSLGQKLGRSEAARQVLANLISAGLDYKQEFVPVSVVTDDEQLGKALDAIGLQYSRATDALAAVREAGKRIAIVSATFANLRVLASSMDQVRAFWNRGGTIVFNGLTPEGLADYNRIVGVDHLIRPFARERVTFPPVRNPLFSGLTTGDIVMLSGERIFNWTADEYVASDVFTYVVDYDDIAPFAKSDFASYGNIVNGFVGSDGWPLIIDFPIPAGDKPFSIKITLPREETITEMTYDPSVNYNPTTRITLAFDGRDRMEFPLQADGDPQTFAIQPPHKAKELTLETCAWQIDPVKARNQGIDNIWIRVQRDPEFHATVRPMLNIGAMMQYVEGPGGVVLCNLRLQENEAVPLNRTKKRTILATVLRNLKAPLGGAKTIIAGANLDYTPIDIHTKATTYKDERGFFGDNRRTFKGLPQGRQRFAGVDYDIYEMPTSPVPQVLMLGGKGLPRDLPRQINGIPVHAKADALFFLHAARVDQRMNDRDRREQRKFVMFKYVVNYADGQKEEVPICSEIDIDHYVQQRPRALPGAQIAWTGPYEDSPDKAVAYAKQWNNPRADVQIASVDVAYVDEGRGVPALLAITAARAK